MADLKQEKEQLASLENLFWQRKFSEAAELAETLHREYPHSFQINFLYVKILKELKRWQESESVLTRLMESFPDNVSILQEWADVCVHLDKSDEAREYYNKILFLDPFNVNAKEALNRLESARSQPDADEPSTADKIPPKADEADMSLTTNVYKTVEPKKESAKPKAEAGPAKPSKWSISKGDTLPEDTLPDAFLDNIAREIQKSRRKEPVQPEEKEILKEKFERTDDDIQIEIEDLNEAPPVPEVTEPKSDDQKPELSDMGGLEDFEKVDWDKEFGQSAASESQTVSQSRDDEEESMEEDETDGTSGEGDLEFVTESAAELYLSQGLYEEAIGIYQKIYNLSQDERFLRKMREVRTLLVHQRTIQKLTEFLKLIQKKGEHFV